MSCGSQKTVTFSIKTYDGTVVTFTYRNKSNDPDPAKGNYEFVKATPDVDLFHYGAGNIWGSKMEFGFTYKGIRYHGFITFKPGGCKTGDDDPDTPTTTTTTTTTTSSTTTVTTLPPAPPTCGDDPTEYWVAFYVDITWGANIIGSGILAVISYFDTSDMSEHYIYLNDTSNGAGSWLIAECISIPATAINIEYTVDVYFSGEKTVGEDYYDGSGNEGGGAGSGLPGGSFSGCAEFTESSPGAADWQINPC